jgi:hypothetical protein
MSPSGVSALTAKRWLSHATGAELTLDAIAIREGG